jgi:hypothetical protein
MPEHFATCPALYRKLDLLEQRPSLSLNGRAVFNFLLRASCYQEGLRGDHVVLCFQRAYCREPGLC